jgi:hypothetical protein
MTLVAIARIIFNIMVKETTSINVERVCLFLYLIAFKKSHLLFKYLNYFPGNAIDG